MTVFNRERHSSGSGVAAAYIIEQSCRFNDDDGAEMSKSFSGVSDDPDKATVACWIKRGNLGAQAGSCKIFDHGGGWEGMHFDATDHLYYQFNSSNTGTSKAVYRDPSAWMHVAYITDTSLAAETDRIKLFVNGVRIEDADMTSTSYPTQDQNAGRLFGSSGNFTIAVESTSSNQFDGYMADFIGLDGIAAAITDLGETDDNGNWIPKDPSTLTFGTNGFWLDFAVAPGTGNGAGTDVSGNANHFTDSGLAANDQMLDSPTDDADNDIGNYATWNPLAMHSSGVTLSNGNLTTVTGSDWYTVTSTIGGFSSGKWYWELTAQSGYPQTSLIGVIEAANGTRSLQTQTDNVYYFGWGLRGDTGAKVDHTTSTGSYGSAVADGEVVMVALDMDNGKIWMGKDGTWFSSGDPAAGTNAAYTNLLSTGTGFVTPAKEVASDSWVTNFGQTTFAHTPPAGFKAINTANLPAPAVTDPSKYMQVDTFTGTGAELVRTLTDAGGSAYRPDFVWVKDRDTGVGHRLTDITRGATIELASDTNAAEVTSAQGVKSFDTSGYTLGTDTDYNASSSPNVAYTWNTQGGAGSSNTAGSINTTTTSVGTTQGFSISTYTGNGVVGATVGHGLGAVPDFWFVKDRANANGWNVYHSANTAAPETDFLILNTTAATADSDARWNDTAPTSSVISLGDGSNVNTNTRTYVLYCWAGVEGYSKFGTYAGNASTDGPFIWCGFRPAFLIIKTTSGATGSWMGYNHKTPGFNPDNFHLNLEETTAVEDTTDRVNFLSNGFKLIIGNGPNAAVTLCFAAFAEFPFGGEDVSQARAR